MDPEAARGSGRWPNEPVDILIVEDSPADERLMKEALQERDIEELHSVRDRAEALAFLRREAGFTAAPRPDLILLDLNLPRVDGYDVLAEVKGDTELRKIPVVVFSSSEDPDDIERSYDLDANSYVTKSGDLLEYRRKIHGIEEYWLTVADLPENHRSRVAGAEDGEGHTF